MRQVDIFRLGLLIGLPPTPEEVDAFEADSQLDAFSKLVDRLLESPNYGERWGRHWLDGTRYSDGFGSFLDNQGQPHAWHSRDWVIDALNRDLPFNEFVHLQIEGDLIDNEDGAVATGFFAVGPTYVSDGGDPEATAQARSETLADRVDTLSRGIPGLTVSCARCHDHKFDPIPQLDYYSPGNSGTLGERPTHPELLDWLTSRFIEQGWSIKQLHRDMMNSAAHSMSSLCDEQNFNADGDNRLLRKMNPRRLDIEAWRDAERDLEPWVWQE